MSLQRPLPEHTLLPAGLQDGAQLRHADRQRWAQEDRVWVLRSTRAWLPRDLEVLRPVFERMRTEGPGFPAQQRRLGRRGPKDARPHRRDRQSSTEGRGRHRESPGAHGEASSAVGSAVRQRCGYWDDAGHAHWKGKRRERQGDIPGHQVHRPEERQGDEH